MGIRKIVWSRKAVQVYTDTFLWYRQECGEQFAQKFFHGILDTIDLLAQMPTIGIVDSLSGTDKRPYYSFLAHPKYRIIYRFTQTTLYIVALRATMMNSK